MDEPVWALARYLLIASGVYLARKAVPIAEAAISSAYLSGRSRSQASNSQWLLKALDDLQGDPIRSDDIVVLSPGLYRQTAADGPSYWDDKSEANLKSLSDSSLRLRFLDTAESMPVLCAIYLAITEAVGSDWRRRPYGTIVIVPPGTPLDYPALARGLAPDFKKRCVPFDREVPGMPAVLIDDASPIEGGIRRALTNGYKSFVLLGGPRPDRTSERRLNAAIRQLEKTDDPSVSFVVFRAKARVPGYPVDNASGEYLIFKRFVRERLYARTRATAIVTATSQLAEQAHRLVTEVFGSWPENMTIVQGGDELRESRLSESGEWHQGSRQRIDDEAGTVLRQLTRLREGESVQTLSLPVDLEST